MAARRVILLQGHAREESGIAGAQLTPGMLVEIDTSGDREWKPHASAGGGGVLAFVRAQHENDGAGIDTAIASGDDCTVIFPEMGAKVNAVTDDTIARGDVVQSAGNGKVEPLTSGGVGIGVAAEASDLSGTVGRVAIIITPIPA